MILLVKLDNTGYRKFKEQKQEQYAAQYNETFLNDNELTELW